MAKQVLFFSILSEYFLGVADLCRSLYFYSFWALKILFENETVSKDITKLQPIQFLKKEGQFLCYRKYRVVLLPKFL